MGGSCATEFVVRARFFDVYEVGADFEEFMIDSKRFLLFMQLCKDKEWVEMTYNLDTKRLEIVMETKGGAQINFSETYYQADYGDGFVCPDVMYTNAMSFGWSEFKEFWGVLCTCVVEGISMRQNARCVSDGKVSRSLLERESRMVGWSLFFRLGIICRQGFLRILEG